MSTLELTPPTVEVDTAALGHPIHGPRALTDDWRRFIHLTFTIARTEWKLRFYGSALGYVWQLMRPLLLFGVLYVFFTKVSHVDKTGQPGEEFYGSQLLGSIVLFTFFGEATGGAVRSVADRENLVRKIQFPRMVIPLAVVLVAAFNLGLNLVVVLIFALAEGVRPMLSWVELPLIIAGLAILSTGIAMLLSAMFVYFRDIQPIWDVFQQVLFYASPVIIPLYTIYQHFGRGGLHLYMLNPLAVVMQQFRHAMVTHSTMSVGAALGGWVQLLEPAAIVLGLFALGFYVFNRTAPYVAENL